LTERLKSALTGASVTDAPLDYHTVLVLQAIYRSPLFLQSNLARTNSAAIGELASRGFITTHVGKGSHGSQWRVTKIGLTKLGV
jgi:hypothetical protein